MGSLSASPADLNTAAVTSLSKDKAARVSVLALIIFALSVFELSLILGDSGLQQLNLWFLVCLVSLDDTCFN